MARPKKSTVDYFPHIIKQGKTITILENHFGNDGYAFWFKLLEILGSTEGHFYVYKTPADIEFLVAKTKVSKEKAEEILNLLADLEAIDKKLWRQSVIWSDNFLANVADVYGRRRTSVPQKPVIDGENPSADEFPGRELEVNGVSTDINPQSKVKYSKVKESKVDQSKEKEIKKEDRQIGAFAPAISEIHNCWLDLLSDINNARLTKYQKELIVTKLKKWDKDKIIQAIQNYNEVLRSDFFYKHNFSMAKFIKRGNGAPRFLPGLDQEHDGDLWKDYVQNRKVKNKKDDDLKELYLEAQVEDEKGIEGVEVL